MLRLRSELLGKNARAMYCWVLVGSTENSTALLRVVQFASADGTWVKFDLRGGALPQAGAAAFIALTTAA